MRIAQVAPLLGSVSVDSFSDVGRSIHYLVDALLAMGHEVTLYATMDSETEATLQPQSLMAQDGRRWLAYHLLMMEQVYSREAEYDVIHSHLEFLAGPLAKRHDIPSVATVHVPLRPSGKPLYHEYESLPLVGISQSRRNYPFPALNWQEVVYPGVTADLFEPRYEQGEYLAYFNPINTTSGLLSAIEMAERVGMPIKIASSNPILFDANFYRAIRPHFNKVHVSYVGELSREEKHQFLREAYALVMPLSWDEPFGLVVLEAMACGTPVIMGGRGVANEIIDEGVTGFADFGTMPEAVQRVQQVAELDRKACRQQFETRFTAKEMATRYLDIYQKVADFSEVYHEKISS